MANQFIYKYEKRNNMTTNNTTSQSTGGIGFFGLLAVLFIGLKLTGYIAWSWWWVLAPLWLPISIFLSILLVGIIVTGVVMGVASLFSKNL
jgi:hypothetical protein